MQESYMKKLLLIGLLLSSFLVIAMEKAVVTVPERKAKGFVTIIKEFPFDITKNGRYALPKGEEIKVLDVFDGKKELNAYGRLPGCITTHRDVTWVQLNLKRSEERRVGKEIKYRWWWCVYDKN